MCVLCNEMIMYRMKRGSARQLLYISRAEVLAQLNGLSDGTAAGSGLWLMMSLGLSRSPKVSVCSWQRIKKMAWGKRHTTVQYCVLPDTMHTCTNTMDLILFGVLYLYQQSKHSRLEFQIHCFVLTCCSVKLAGLGLCFVLQENKVS